MAEGDAVLVVTPDPERHATAEAALKGTAAVVAAHDLASALEAISIGGFRIALIDVELSDGGPEHLLSALGAPGRAAVWTDVARPDLVEYGAYVQIPHGVGRAALSAALRWLLEVQESGEPPATDDAAAELEKVLDLVADVRHDLNNPLTAILAEVQLQLMDRDRLPDEQTQSLEMIEEQTQRMRELVKKLRDLKR